VCERGSRNRIPYETLSPMVAAEREMKVILVLVILLIAAASALAYGASVTAGVSVVTSHGTRATETTTLLLSGSLLLGLAGAMRRLPQ